MCRLHKWKFLYIMFRTSLLDTIRPVPKHMPFRILLELSYKQMLVMHKPMQLMRFWTDKLHKLHKLTSIVPK